MLLRLIPKDPGSHKIKSTVPFQSSRFFFTNSQPAKLYTYTKISNTHPVEVLVLHDPVLDLPDRLDDSSVILVVGVTDLEHNIQN